MHFDIYESPKGHWHFEKISNGVVLEKSERSRKSRAEVVGYLEQTGALRAVGYRELPYGFMTYLVGVHELEAGKWTATAREFERFGKGETFDGAFMDLVSIANSYRSSHGELPRSQPDTPNWLGVTIVPLRVASAVKSD